MHISLTHRYREQAPPTLDIIHIQKKNINCQFYYFQVLKTRFIIAPQKKTHTAL